MVSFTRIPNGNSWKTDYADALLTLGNSPREATVLLKTVNNVSQTVKVISGDGNDLRIYPFEDELKSLLRK